MRARIDAINTQIKELEAERLKLQESCTHPETQVVMYSYRVGNYWPKVVCSDCCAVVGLPETDSEKRAADEILKSWGYI